MAEETADLRGIPLRTTVSPKWTAAWILLRYSKTSDFIVMTLAKATAGGPRKIWEKSLRICQILSTIRRFPASK